MRAADSARVVHLCAARCAPFVAHKWPTHALRLTQALCEKTSETLKVSGATASKIYIFMSDELKTNIEYAVRLSDPEVELIFEERFKLASLCEEIHEQKLSGLTVDSETMYIFNSSILSLYKRNSDFRSEVERFPGAKELIKSIQ